MSPCHLQGTDRPAQCGSVEVLEDPEAIAGRKIRIQFAVISAASSSPRKDPIVALMGGPGESAIEAAQLYSEWLAHLLVDRDLLLIDQRGAGISAPLKCNFASPSFAEANLRDFFPPAAVAACRKDLEGVADLRRYTYAYFANDLEEIRRELGYSQYNLFAGSYGTRAAQTYLRAYPHSVRTAYLGSVVPVNIEGPLDFSRNEDAALKRLFARCQADPKCHKAYPELPKEWLRVLEQLDAGRALVTVPGHKNAVPLSRGRVVEWVRSRLYRPSESVALPWTIHRAANDEWGPIAAGVMSQPSGLSTNISLGLFFSIVCSEDMPFVREEDVARETAGTFLGDYRLRQQQKACEGWPQSQLPPGYRSPMQSDVPTLFVTGDEDGGTPVSFTDTVDRGFANHAAVIARGQGHTEWSSCIAAKYERLVSSGSVNGLNSPQCPATPFPPFKIGGRVGVP